MSEMNQFVIAAIVFGAKKAGQNCEKDWIEIARAALVYLKV